jgi:hypothetical protein
LLKYNKKGKNLIDFEKLAENIFNSKNASELLKHYNTDILETLQLSNAYKFIDFDMNFLVKTIKSFLNSNDLFLIHLKDHFYQIVDSENLKIDNLNFENSILDNSIFDNSLIENSETFNKSNSECLKFPILSFHKFPNNDNPHIENKMFNKRVIHIYESFLADYNKFKILKNLILHACNKTKNKVYARNCEIIVKPAKEMKQFFIDNNIQGYRVAKKAFVLIDKKTKEPLMCYTVGHAYFGKGIYDAEIARGASKLGYSVIGGASKLWNFIIDYYKTRNLDETPGSVNSIVYYVDRNFYNGKSMNFLSGQKFIKSQPGFWNFWVETKELKNREPNRHSYIMEQQKNGKLFPVKMAGTDVNVWER